ncbi:tetratricopeptide repeat protein [Janthinobacterium aquaticum]|uniref:tetratricopeptide repeat protein n=1 Tax=Janthinobacterium sp. FT58W TaxID=2654254 RepID=UPI00186B5683|nr:tetratricopeptide repeat protein [Janthinobacterium sp. FT58W]
MQIAGKDAVPALQEAAALAPSDAEAQVRLGCAQMDNGQPEQAMACFMRALELAPAYAEALSRLGDALQAQGHLKEAAECYRGALEIDPSLLMALAGKGDMQQAQGQYQAAQASYQQALALAPDAAELHCKLGDVHVALNRPEPAMRSYAAALQSEPGNAMAHGGMGNVLFRLDRNAEAVLSYRKATAQPNAIAAHFHGLGRSLHATGETAEAENAYRQAIAMDSTVAAPMLHYADLLRETRRQGQAIAIYQAALLLEPKNIEALNNMGIAQEDDGQFEQALASFRKVLELAPDNPVTHNNIAAILNTMGQSKAALDSCRLAVKLGPKSASAHVNLGVCLTQMGRLDEAVKAFEKAVRFEPQNRRAHVNLSSTLAQLGRIDQAISSSRAAIKINPDWEELHSNLLFYLTHSQDVDAKALFAEHMRYAAHFETPHLANWPAHSNTREPERRLRIGFVSADLYKHAVANFITPVLEHLAQSPRLEIFAYANSFHDDVVSRHLHGLVSVWRQVEKLTHAELTQLITSDAIDILIDLSGHTGFNRLPVFARKPAPLQVSWIGYPGTTGLQAMDYFLADRYYSPPGVFDSQFSEKLVRLPASAVFLPSPDAPNVNPAPAISNGYITFGSFNRASKLSLDVIERWSALLRAVPDAKMVLGGMPNHQTSDRFRAWFKREGIAANRLTFFTFTNSQDYLALHHLVDVCLDTFPYNGGTTTLHALWMGVPTLTMMGPTLPGRVGAAICHHVGLAEFIADDKEDFITKGKQIAGDIVAIADLRTELRDRLKHSAACQPAVIAAGLESAMRVIWRNWCAGYPAKAFNVAKPGNIGCE